MDAIRETSSLIAADKVQGTWVYNAAGENLGSIYDLMIDKKSGNVAYAIMSFGGFLGIGNDYHPLPWTPFCLSSGDSSGVDFLLALHDEGEDLSCEIALQGSNGVQLGMPFGDSACDVVLGLRSVRRRPMAIMCKALLAARSPPRLSRCLTVFPDEAGTGLTPHRDAKLASDRNLSGLSPAVRRSCAAPL